jgi:hypothetical protein
MPLREGAREAEKKVGFASPVLFLHTYESRGARIVAEVEGYGIEVQIKLHWFGLLPAWSRYDW